MRNALAALFLMLLAACVPTPTPVAPTLAPVAPTMVADEGQPFVVVVTDVESNVEFADVPVTDGSAYALKLPQISGYAYSYNQGTPGHLYVAYKEAGVTHSWTLYRPVGDPDNRDWTVIHDLNRPTYLKVEEGDSLHFGVKGEFSLYGKPSGTSWQLAFTSP